MTQQHTVAELTADLVGTTRRMAARGLCPATGGNFSVRLNHDTILITASGTDKAEVTENDLIRVRRDGGSVDHRTPSAETALHLAVYRLAPEANAVLHVHSVANTVLSRLTDGDRVTVCDYEMQKAIRGVATHAAPLDLPILENSQEMPALARHLEPRRDQLLAAHGFVVRGHGLYVWGETLAEARRHLDGWEFLLACELARFQAQGQP